MYNSTDLIMNEIFKEAINRNDHCKQCYCNHNGICFFAWKCEHLTTEVNNIFYELLKRKF